MKKTPVKQSFLLLLFFVGTLLFVGCGGKNTKEATALEQMATELNTQCPMLIAPDIRLESCEAVPENTLQYTYTLTNIDANIDTTAIQSIKSEMVEAIRTQADMKKLRDMGAKFSYQYKNKDGKLLCQILISPEDYK